MNYCFLDLECTCDGIIENGKFIPYRDKRSPEIISVGVVILDSNMKVTYRFFSHIKPYKNTCITDYCNALTGITQADIDKAPYADVMFPLILKKIKSAKIDKVYVYGSYDHFAILKTGKLAKKIMKNKKAGLFQLLPYITDISDKIKTDMQMNKTPSVERLCDILKIQGDSNNFHNALYDAKMLAMIYAAIYGNGKSHQVFLEYLKSLPEKNDAKRKKPEKTHEKQ